MKIEQFQWSATGEWKPNLNHGTLADSAQAVFLFGRAKLIKESGCLEALRKAYPKAHIVGCSTAGEIHNATVRDDTITATAVAFEHTRLGTAKVTIESPDRSFEAGEKLARQLDPKGLRHVLVFSEGLRVNASDLVNGMNAVLPKGVLASGGCAGDGNRLQATHVWCDGEPVEAGAVAVGLYGERLQVGVSAIGGWKPFGPDRLITKSKQNVLYEIDGKPALTLYKQYLGKYADGLPASGLMFPLELAVNGQRVLRALLAVNEADQSITFAGNVPEGTYARFMVGHTDDLVEGTQVAAKGSMQRLKDVDAQLSLLVSCNGRRFVLKQRTEEEVEAVREALGPKTVMAGFYSYGEIAPTDSDHCTELHNETMTITSLAEV